MGKSYKYYDNGAQRRVKSKRNKDKEALKELSSKSKEKKTPYNSVEGDHYDGSNFEKFKRRRWLGSKYL